MAELQLCVEQTEDCPPTVCTATQTAMDKVRQAFPDAKPILDALLPALLQAIADATGPSTKCPAGQGTSNLPHDSYQQLVRAADEARAGKRSRQLDEAPIPEDDDDMPLVQAPGAESFPPTATASHPLSLSTSGPAFVVPALSLTH